MNNKITSLLRSTLAASILLTSPGLASYAVAGETFSFKAPVRIAVAPVIAPAVNISNLNTVPISGVDANIANVGAIAQIPIIEANAIVPEAAAVMPSALSIEGPQAQAQDASAKNEPGALGTLIATQKPETGAPATAETSGWRWSGLFDLMKRGRGLSDSSAPAAIKGNSSLNPSGLSIAKTSASSSKPSLPNPSRPTSSRGFARAGTLVAIAALVLALPTLAMAATASAPVVASVSLLTSIHPLATALASAAGAVWGLIAAHKEAGKAPSMGEAMASVLKYGILAGAGTFMLLDLTQSVFLGGFSATALMKPLPFGLAAAALGQSAFAGKFVDPNSTPGERIMGAFPAVAVALGLTAGIAAFTTVAAPLAFALGVMSITGVASAIYAAIYKPGKSSAEGPKLMGRGFVLQSLMGGLALSLTNPYLSLPLAALAMWGFWNVISTTAREVFSQLLEYVKGLRAPKP